MVWMLDAFRPDKGDYHHTLPRSRGGSDEKSNVTEMDRHRHGEYHYRIAANRDPLTVTRLIALHSIGYRNLTMDPESLDSLFEETTRGRWQRLYEDGALADNRHPQRAHLGERADYFARLHAGDELKIVERVLRCVDSGGHLPWQTSNFLPNTLNFFGAQSTTEAIRRLHTEKVQGQLAWVKALRGDVSADVLSLLGDKKISYDRGAKNDLRLTLSTQRNRLINCLNRWKKDEWKKFVA